MQQQQHQQAGQQNSTVVQQSISSEKLRDQARPSKQVWNDSKSLPHPQGSLQRPTSGPVQGIPTHHQRVQNSMNAQFGSMASPPQLSNAPSPQSNGQLPSQGQNPPQGQIPPQYLPQLQGCFVAMHKAAGQGGVGMSQARPLAPVSQDRGVGADPSALATITSGPASGGLHNPGVMYSSMQQGQAGSTSSAPILTSNFVAFHPVSQGGDSRMLHSGSRHQPSGVYLNLVPVLQLAMLLFRDWGVHMSASLLFLYSCRFLVSFSSLGSQSSVLSSMYSLSGAKGTKLEASAGNIAHSGSSGPMQQASQVAPTQAPRPSLLSGAGAEGQVASQLPLQQQAGVGFTKQQLVVLRNQIMAFKRLKTRKVCDTHTTHTLH
jgi:SWI/SNF-related matrix-associated actin-dependent regulator of chromatin subfamily A protein 2/4